MPGSMPPAATTFSRKCCGSAATPGAAARCSAWTAIHTQKSRGLQHSLVRAALTEPYAPDHTPDRHRLHLLGDPILPLQASHGSHAPTEQLLIVGMNGDAPSSPKLHRPTRRAPELANTQPEQPATDNHATLWPPTSTSNPPGGDGMAASTESDPQDLWGIEAAITQQDADPATGSKRRRSGHPRKPNTDPLLPPLSKGQEASSAAAANKGSTQHHLTFEQQLEAAWQEADTALASAPTQHPGTKGLPQWRRPGKKVTQTRKDSPWYVLDQQQLTSNLTRAHDWQTLALLLSVTHTVSYNHIHVAAAWARLADLRSQAFPWRRPYEVPLPGVMEDNQQEVNDRFSTPQYLQLTATLEELTDQQCSAMRPREACTILWSAAVVSHPLPPALISGLLQVVLEQPASDHDLSLTTWAISQLMPEAVKEPGTPDHVFKQGMSFEPVQADNTANADSSTATSEPNSMQGSSSSGAQEPQGWQHEWAAAPPPAPKPQAVDAGVQVFPDLTLKRTDTHTQAVLVQQCKQLAQQVVLQLHTMSDRSMLVALQGLAMQQQVVLSSADKAHIAHMVNLRSAGFEFRDVASCLSSVANLGLRPSERWMKQTMDQVALLLPSARLDEISLVLHACVLLNFQPPGPLLMELCGYSLRCLSTGSLRHLVMMTWSFSRMRWRPPPIWLDALCAEVTSRKAGLHAHEISLLLYGLAMVQYIPSPAIMAVLLPHVEYVLDEEWMMPMQLACICWALPRLTPHVGASMVQALQDLLMMHLTYLPHHVFAKMLWCIARCATQQPEREWMHAVVQEFMRRLPYLGVRELPMSFWSLAKLGYHHEHTLFTLDRMATLWERVTALLPALQLQGITALLHATAWVNYAPVESALQEVADSVATYYASMSPRTLQGVSSVLWHMRQRRRQLHARYMKLKTLRRKLKLRHVKKPRLLQMPQHSRPWRPVGWMYKPQVQGMSDVSFTVTGRRTSD